MEGAPLLQQEQMTRSKMLPMDKASRGTDSRLSIAGRRDRQFGTTAKREWELTRWRGRKRERGTKGFFVWIFPLPSWFEHRDNEVDTVGRLDQVLEKRQWVEC